MNKWHRISYDNFVEEYILPNEDNEIKLKWYKGTIDFDDDYIKEIATHNNLIIKDL
jgi:hypothetical protein